MKIFEVRDFRIPSLIVIGDNVHHASHIFMLALYHGLQHFPKAELTIGEYDPLIVRQTEPMRNWAQGHQAGIVHRTNDGGWELISPRNEED